MPSPEIIYRQIESVTADLITISLCDRQNFPAIKELPNGCRVITFNFDGSFSVALKDIPYEKIYKELDSINAFNFRMLDGALVQMMYLFRDGAIESHRLAFLPSPHLEEYQNNPDIYQEDEVFADVIKKNIVPFPIRFDFDSREEVFLEVEHPKSHMTLGQYENCRIPVTAPLTPFMFCNFLLRNFYNTAYQKHCESLTEHKDTFPVSIFDAERELVHIGTPNW